MAEAQTPEDPLAALRIDLDELEEGRHEVEASLPQAWIGEVLSSTDAQARDDGRAHLELDIQGDRTVLVRGRLELRYVVPCARCLDDAFVDVGSETQDLCVTYVPAERLRQWAEVSGEALEGEGDEIEPLDPSELDELGYEGKHLDLRELVSEQILLAYPMRALCARGEACLGLCSNCGANLNHAVEGDPELAAAGSPPSACPKCGHRLDGSEPEGAADTPWKKALAGVSLQDSGSKGTGGGGSKG